jgi:ferredoxin-type protein NapH
MPWIDTAVLILTVYAAAVIVGIFAILKFTKNKTRKVSHLRLYVQFVALLAVFMGLLIGPFNTPQSPYAPLGPAPRDNLLGGAFLGGQFPDGISVPILACYYPSGRTVTCPIWQIQAYIFPFWDAGLRGYGVFYTTTGLEKLGIVFGFIIVMSLVLGRFFCGWLCPFGLYMDLLTRVRKGTGQRHLSFSARSNAKLRQFSYIIIAVIIILSFIFGSQAIFGTQIIPGTTVGGPQGTEAGITGRINEPFCLVCPVRPLCSLAECAVGSMSSSYVFGLVEGPLYIFGFYVNSINLAVLVFVTILALVYRRFWCRICPLGALTALFSSFKPFKQIALTKLKKNEEKCTKCGVCKRVCPTQATDVYEKKGGDVTESRCMLCARCVETCPYAGALELKFAGKTIMKSRNWLE